MRSKDVSVRVVIAMVCGLMTVMAACVAADAQTVVKRTSHSGACGKAVHAQLGRLGIDPDSVKGIYVQRREIRRRLGNGLGRHLIGYTAWVTPKVGKGNLVMDLFVNCRVQRVYTSGGYQLPSG